MPAKPAQPDQTDVRSQIDNTPMSSLQIGVIVICYLLNMLDGADVLVVSFAAPLLAEQWSIDPRMMGAIFSAGLIGMTLGALFLGPFTDTLGRRNVLLLSVVVIASGLMISSIAQSPIQLIVLRFCTGLGIGAMLASLASMAAEYAPKRYQNFVVALVYSGYPIGATLTGFLSVWILPQYGWPALFFGAGCITALMLPIMYFWLPESLEFLSIRQPKNALPRINKTLARMKFVPISELPTAVPATTKAPNVKALLSEGRAGSTIKLWAAFGFAFLTLYYLLSWIPTLATRNGLPLEQALFAGAMFNLGAVIGVTGIGILSRNISIRVLILTFMSIGAAIMVLVGTVTVPKSVFLLEMFVLGISGHAAFIALYSVAAGVYGPEMRSTGIGWAIGAGRIGGVLGPYLGGLLIAMGLQPMYGFIVFALPFVLAGVAVFLIDARHAE